MEKVFLKMFPWSFCVRVFAALPLLAMVLLSPADAQTARLDAARVAGGFTAPVFVTAPPGDTSRLFVVQQTGQILIINLPSRTVNAIPYLDISSEIVSGGEQGLLGMAFDPHYATNGRFYLLYTAPGGAGVVHIAQFTVSSDPDVADPGSEATLLMFDHPQTNHNAGWIGFSPRPGDEGNLYITSGDGGGANDAGGGHIEPGGNAQNTTTLLGKMLRIHIENTYGTYSIPRDNPFYGSQTDTDRQEIFCFGLRNPFRASFDRATGTMFIGDVGQSSREEIDVQKASNPGGGENYGWRVREGFIQNPAYPDDPPPPDAVDPIFDYPRTTGQTIIGGYVYRGSRIPSLSGIYVFADYLGPEGGSSGRIWAFRYNGQNVSGFRDITSQLFPTRIGNFPLNNPSSLGEDARGELYICDITNGNIYKIIPAP